MTKTATQRRDEKYLLLAHEYKAASAVLDVAEAKCRAAGLTINDSNGLYIYWADKRGRLRDVLYEPLRDSRNRR